MDSDRAIEVLKEMLKELHWQQGQVKLADYKTRAEEKIEAIYYVISLIEQDKGIPSKPGVLDCRCPSCGDKHNKRMEKPLPPKGVPTQGCAREVNYS